MIRRSRFAIRRPCLSMPNGGNPKNYDDVLHLVQEDPADRFVALLDKIKLAHQHLGLIRMSHLHQTHLLGAYVASDINLLAELSSVRQVLRAASSTFLSEISSGLRKLEAR